MNFDDPQERSVVAGEYVLGTLGAPERAAFDAALPTDPLLQAEVYAWQDRLLGLSGRVVPAEPPRTLWSGIEAVIARGDAAPVAPAASRSAGPAAPAANDPLWRRLRRWQAAGGLAIAASVVLAALLVLRPPVPATGGDRYLALLQAPEDKQTGWIVEASPAGGVRLVPVGATAAVPPGKSLQFWTKAKGASGPTSLGLVTPGRVTELPAARLPTIEAEQLFELTLEPEAGSPLNRPTGPILFVGRTVRLL